MMWGWNFSDGSWLAMGLGMLLWAGLTVLLVWLVVRALDRSANRGPTSDANLPEQVLRERFARGEIDEKEYRDRLAVIRS